MSRAQKNLQLEFLESRVMLSGVDTVVSGVSLVDSAIQSNDAQVSLELLPYGQVLKITGSGHGNVSVDLNQLPTSIVNLQIFSFENVTFVGNHAVSYLTLSDVHKADAGHILVESTLFAYNVEQIRIDQAPSVVLLGSDGAAGRKTLIEAGSFSPGLLFSSVENLGLSSAANVGEINIVSGNAKQTVLLNFQPSRLNVTGVDSPSTQISVVRGDFRGYFLASSSERAALEQSLLIARQTAVANLVPLTALLSNPVVLSALSEVVGTGPGVSAFWSQTTAVINEPALQITNNLTAPFMDSGKAVTSLLQHGVSVQSSPEQSPWPSGGDLSAQQGTMSVAPKADAGILTGLFDAKTASANQRTTVSTGAVSGATSTALTNLAEPFSQMVVDLRGRFSTFGDIAVAQVADYLQTESRPVLLVDARSSLERDSGGLTVLKL